jgi:hypothetical protein
MEGPLLERTALEERLPEEPIEEPLLRGRRRRSDCRRRPWMMRVRESEFTHRRIGRALYRRIG